ncbi:hypothetical protein [Marinimicrobium sp. C2-29]|uniref:hypothetical protein n=1 Tax=Marinimicrobium sp. C2-29 TaxID=3139825 RepID=UPI003138E7AB
MAELDQVINRAEAFEREQAQASDWSEPEAEPERVQVQGVDPMEAAQNMGESFLRVVEVGVTTFVDQRLRLDDEEIEAGRASLGPAIDKHHLTAGDGRLPYQEEITAGFYLGGLWRRIKRTLTELRAKDKAEAKRKQQQEEGQANGDQREHQPQEQPHALSGEQRIREESDAPAPGWNSEQFL